MIRHVFLSYELVPVWARRMGREVRRWVVRTADIVLRSVINYFDELFLGITGVHQSATFIAREQDTVARYTLTQLLFTL